MVAAQGKRPWAFFFGTLLTVLGLPQARQSILPTPPPQSPVARSTASLLKPAASSQAGFLFGTSTSPTAFEGSQRTQLGKVELLGGSPGRQLPKRAGASFETSEPGGNNASASNLIGYRARRTV